MRFFSRLIDMPGVSFQSRLDAVDQSAAPASVVPRFGCAAAAPIPPACALSDFAVAVGHIATLPWLSGKPHLFARAVGHKPISIS
ncbi:hypothetical protein A1D31_22495 [Bradyrhizobium liaoningense]|nr:hypothetical protein A1D31_22495 [Bradyrhizobium liaoningense]